ncbi:hypothetical protein protein, putative [Babesia ovis]|uniref:Uncharacterized protein n=1 Tax=Babesia ovis TaxID=5869 RepID=A0A9W5TD34_BABOV|nr:hypothetical protein protein, putative [Babesia ovis]
MAFCCAGTSALGLLKTLASLFAIALLDLTAATCTKVTGSTNRDHLNDVSLETKSPGNRVLYQVMVLVLLALMLAAFVAGSLVAIGNSIQDAGLGVDIYAPIALHVIGILLGAGLFYLLCKMGYAKEPLTKYHYVVAASTAGMVVASVIVYGATNGMEVYYSTFGMHTAHAFNIVYVTLFATTIWFAQYTCLYTRPFCRSQWVCCGATLATVYVLGVAAVTVVANNIIHGGSYTTSGSDETVYTTLKKTTAFLPMLTLCFVLSVYYVALVELPYSCWELAAILLIGANLGSIAAVFVVGNSGGDHTVNTGAFILLGLSVLVAVLLLWVLETKPVFRSPTDTTSSTSTSTTGFAVFASMTLECFIGLMGVYAGYQNRRSDEFETLLFVLLGYEFLLVVPTVYYGYRMGLMNWITKFTGWHGHN